MGEPVIARHWLAELGDAVGSGPVATPVPTCPRRCVCEWAGALDFRLENNSRLLRAAAIERFFKRAVRLKGERAQRRLVAFRARGSPAGYLRTRTVTDKTAEKYKRLYANFVAHSRRRLDTAECEISHDSALDMYLDEKYLEGFAQSVLRDTIYAVAWHLNLHLRDLPLSQMALRGLRKLCPDKSRNPVTWEAVLVIVDELCASADPADVLTGAAAMIQFDSYARPTGLFSVCETDLFPPSRSSASGQVPPPRPRRLALRTTPSPSARTSVTATDCTSWRRRSRTAPRRTASCSHST